MVNSIGLPNKGLDGFLAENLPLLAELPVPLIVSVMATSHDQFARMVETVASREEVAALELNVSCPNVESGLMIGESPQEAEALMRVLRPLTEKPLIVKLTPNVDPVPVGLAAEAAGADALSAINTLRAVPLHPDSGDPWRGAESGGRSGPAVRTTALGQGRARAAAAEVPVIGMGGIGTAEDAAEMLEAGAKLVAVGTESFRDPFAGTRIAAGLADRYTNFFSQSR